MTNFINIWQWLSYHSQSQSEVPLKHWRKMSKMEKIGSAMLKALFAFVECRLCMNKTPLASYTKELAMSGMLRFYIEIWKVKHCIRWIPAFYECVYSIRLFMYVCVCVCVRYTTCKWKKHKQTSTKLHS